jgi:dipeptidyl aminopeptidase/acylaminoacyl peptidase
VRTVTAEDLLRMRFVTDVSLSPDGQRVCFVLTVIERDEAQDELVYRSHLWLVPTDGGPPQQFTWGAHRDRSPRWSADGRWIAFLSDRSGDVQLWVIPAGGGEARPLTRLPGGAAEPCWAPDGGRLVFVSRVGPDPLEAEPDPDKAKRKRQNRVRVITRLRYKLDGEGLWDGKWKQLFVVDLAGGAPKALTDEPCDHTAPVWSPDGRWIAYVANPRPDADWTNVQDIWVLPAEGGPARCLTRSVGPCASPAWSPDGRQVAYLGHDNAYGTATLTRVWVVSAEGGDPRALTAGWDRSAGNHVLDDLRAHVPAGGLFWTADGGRVLFVGGEGGATAVYAADLEGVVQRLTDGDRVVYNLSVDRAGQRAALGVTTPTLPGDVFLVEFADGRAVGERRLTEVNADLLREVTLAEPERAEFRAPDGWTVEGWLLRPPHPSPGQRCPAVLQIHGGPHAAYGWAFFHEFQLLAACGFAVLYTNPRGSQGYGQAFCAATRNDWGGADYRDLMAAVDQALECWPWLDRDRLGVAGGSYGGYMTNWIVTQTDRFRAAVTMRSIANCYSQWGTSDLAYLKGFWEFPGDPWESPSFYLERSPLHHVERVRTPVLILHSEQDLRCPISEAEQWYTALRKRGVETVFVRFPNESHDLSRSGQPEHRLERLRWIVRWFERWLLARGEAAAQLQTAAEAAEA